MPKTHMQEVTELAEMLLRDAEEYNAMLRIARNMIENGNSKLLENMYEVLPDISKYDHAADLCKIIEKIHGCYTEIKAAAT